jgi:hypothetical protein
MKAFNHHVLPSFGVLVWVLNQLQRVLDSEALLAQMLVLIRHYFRRRRQY